MKTIAIIPSGGVGSRFLSSIPKQYVKVLGKELIVYTLEVFQKCKLVDEIIIAAQSEYFDLLNNLKQKYNINKISKIIEGGKERQNSVNNALNNCSLSNDDLVVVHDAARPLLSQTLLEKAIRLANKSDSVVVAIKAKDTLLKGNNNKVENYIDRNSIYYVQTPQIFRYKILNEAFEIANKTNFLATDESMLVKNIGIDVNILEGDSTNFKITTKSDLELFEKIIK
jgi:2-C-methyl-D-erythritol 4-phosphate cytidylyltransferase